MKTAMQELLEWLENSSDVKNDILNWETVKENALEKEKEQIRRDFKNGCKSQPFMDLEYYKQSYIQNKQQM
jgi:hypothetical protein